MRTRLFAAAAGAALVVALVAPAVRDNRSEPDLWAAAAQGFHGSSLDAPADAAEMQAGSDLVVVARVLAAKPGRPFAVVRDGAVEDDPEGKARTTLLDLEVEQVLDGDASAVRSGRLVNVEVPPLFVPGGSLPSESAVFFLEDQAQAAARDKLPEGAIDRGRGFWQLTSFDRGIQIERSQRIIAALEPPADDHEDGAYNYASDARSMQDFVAEIRARAE